MIKLGCFKVSAHESYNTHNICSFIKRWGDVLFLRGILGLRVQQRSKGKKYLNVTAANYLLIHLKV
jgi:hypothetical protein